MPVWMYGYAQKDHGELRGASLLYIDKLIRHGLHGQHRSCRVPNACAHRVKVEPGV